MIAAPINFERSMEKATFLERPNRFTLICQLEGKRVRVFLPNPGRMWELLLPGSTVHLERAPSVDKRLPYTAVAVERQGHPVPVHTLRSNRLAQELIERQLVPGLEGAEIVRREVQVGKSRFDFLLQGGGEEILLEVKSCTLFGQQVAMFPDAVTARGKRHIEELARLAREGRRGAVLFLVYCPHCAFFMPEHHTDLAFTKAILECRDVISIIPLSVELGEDLFHPTHVRLLHIPWEIVKREAEDRGSYILVLLLPERAGVEIGRLGKIRLRKGYYLYVGSARRGLSQRMQRHQRLRKRKFWHIDHLRARAEFQLAIPIRTGDDIECQIGGALKEISEWEVPGFGSSDCHCGSHLYGMARDPLHSPQFISLLQYFRMDRLFQDSGPLSKGHPLRA